jgi:hypothetical protein
MATLTVQFPFVTPGGRCRLAAISFLGCLIALSGCARLRPQPAAPPAAPITFGSLLEEMIDPRSPTSLPKPFHRPLQFSSSDRRSFGAYYYNWFANNDGIGGETQPNFYRVLDPPGPDGIGRFLLARIEGPGAIVRTWTTHPLPLEGRLKVWLDGDRAPLYDGPADPFFHDRTALFRPPSGPGDAPTSAAFTQADACYLPIPFASGLRMEWTGSIRQPHFYHVQVRAYPPGTPVQTFSPADLSRWKTTLLLVQRTLLDPDAYLPPDPHAPVQRFDVTVPPGEAVAIFDHRGPAAIEHLTFETGDDDRDGLLRDLVLEATFEDSFQPQVEVPLGAFFGSAPGLIPSVSLPLTVRPTGTLISRFVMPYTQQAVLRLRNHGDRPRRVTGRAVIGPFDWNEGDSLHFYARWQADDGLPAAAERDSMDIPMLVARGGGRVVGIAAMAMNATQYCSFIGSWWGEGDEKVWIDSLSPFPVIYGTGTEDFFNYSWSSNALFTDPFCGQPLATGPAGRGHVVNYRWLRLDDLPFRDRIDFYIELLAQAPSPGFSYARTVYFYGLRMLRDASTRIIPDRVRNRPSLPTDWQPIGFGADEEDGLYFRAADVVTSGTQPVAMTPPPGEPPDGTWSHGRLLRWEPTAPGAILELKLTVPDTGLYDLRGVFAHTPDAGRFELALDGRTLSAIEEKIFDQPIDLGPVVDLFQPHLTLSRHTLWGRQSLSAGEHTLTLTAHEPAPAGAGNVIGIDFFWLVPRQP